MQLLSEESYLYLYLYLYLWQVAGAGGWVQALRLVLGSKEANTSHVVMLTPGLVCHQNTVRSCTVLYCTVLYCTALYCTVSVTGHGDPKDGSGLGHAGAGVALRVAAAPPRVRAPGPRHARPASWRPHVGLRDVPGHVATLAPAPPLAGHRLASQQGRRQPGAGPGGGCHLST